MLTTTASAVLKTKAPRRLRLGKSSAQNPETSCHLAVKGVGGGYRCQLASRWIKGAAE